MLTFPRTPILDPAEPADFLTIGSSQQHAFGRRYVTWDGRVFKYAKAYGTWNTDLLAQSVIAQHVAYATIARSHPIGAKEIVIDVAATDGAAADGAIAADELADGHLIIFPHSENSMCRLIDGNTVVAATGGEMTLTLERGINIATVIDTSHGECMASPYSSVKASTTGDANRSAIGLPTVPATTGTFGWLQTWGPCWIAPQADVGAVGHSNQCVLRYDGSIQEHENYSAGDTPTGTEYANGVAQQHIGFVLSRATAGTQGAPFVMLQISI